MKRTYSLYFRVGEEVVYGLWEQASLLGGGRFEQEEGGYLASQANGL